MENSAGEDYASLLAHVSQYTRDWFPLYYRFYLKKGWAVLCLVSLSQNPDWSQGLPGTRSHHKLVCEMSFHYLLKTCPQFKHFGYSLSTHCYQGFYLFLAISKTPIYMTNHRISLILHWGWTCLLCLSPSFPFPMASRFLYPRKDLLV